MQKILSAPSMGEYGVSGRYGSNKKLTQESTWMEDRLDTPGAVGIGSDVDAAWRCVNIVKFAQVVVLFLRYLDVVLGRAATTSTWRDKKFEPGLVAVVR